MKNKGLKITVGVLAILLVTVIFVNSNETADTIQQEQVVQRVQVSQDDDAIKGDPNAEVTIVEFSDYECPYCARFYSQTLVTQKV